MTPPTLIEKLRGALSDDVNSETKVVYIIAESRKLLDSHKNNPLPFALELYFHWALHVDLHGAATTMPFLLRVDKFVESFLAGNTNIPHEHQMFREFVHLETFREQFSGFLKAHDLPTSLCDDAARWNEFLRNYAGVIENGSASCHTKSDQLKFVSKIIFKAGKTTPGKHHPFDFVWEINLKDGRTLAVNANAARFPNGDEMIFHTVELKAGAQAIKA